MLRRIVFSTCFMIAFFFQFKSSDTVQAQGLLPFPNHVEHAYDASRGILYVTRGNGDLERFDFVNQTLLPQFSIGNSLGSIALTLDSQFAYIGETSSGRTQGIVRKVDLDTGVSTDVVYDFGVDSIGRVFESGTNDIRITNDGNAFFTSIFDGGSSIVPLRSIDLSTDTISEVELPRFLRSGSRLVGAPDGSGLLLADAGSSERIFSYSPDSGDFTELDTNNFNSGSEPVAVSGDGEFIAYDGELLDLGLNSIQNLPDEGFGRDSSGGYAFDPNQSNVLYSADSDTSQIIAYDIENDFEILATIDIGESIEDIGFYGQRPSNEITIASDGSAIFLSTDSGIRFFNNPLTVSVPEPSAALLLFAVLGSFASRRRRSAFAT